VFSTSLQQKIEQSYAVNCGSLWSEAALLSSTDREELIFDPSQMDDRLVQIFVQNLT